MQKHARLEVNNMRVITEGGNCAGARDFLARTYLNSQAAGFWCNDDAKSE